MGARKLLVMDTFVEVADTLSGDYDIGDFLQTLVERCAETPQVTTGGAGRGTRWSPAATSDEMKRLEDLEIELEQAPCLDAYQRDEQILVEDLRGEDDRWPKVAPKAVDIGMLGADAFPLTAGDCIGALTLYRETTGEFQDDDVRLAQAFADGADPVAP